MSEEERIAALVAEWRLQTEIVAEHEWLWDEFLEKFRRSQEQRDRKSATRVARQVRTLIERHVPTVPEMSTDEGRRVMLAACCHLWLAVKKLKDFSEREK